MCNSVILFENVSKQYRLGTIGTGTLSHDLKRWWTVNVRGKEDPYLKIGSINDRSLKADSEYVWALKNIDLEIKQGEVMGIIGKNGAGKSTLLKILSRITSPTAGRIKAKGRIASLLEVGTGFHPEMTGRENIFMNGSIMGMTKTEIRKKMDEIVDFAGVERYVDTPVKRYSNGMTVRLGFAIAAHLEPEILVVDEVLAVGDAEFQKKAIGKMKDVSKGDGRTVLFVSHNMASIKQLCTKCLLLKNGLIDQIGDTSSIVRHYLENPIFLKSENDLISDVKSRRGNGEMRFVEISINNGELYLDPQKEIYIDCKAKAIKNVDSAYFLLLVNGADNSEPITNTGLICVTDSFLNAGSIISFRITLPANTFRTGLFPLYLWLGKQKGFIGDNYPFDVIDSVYYLNLASDKKEEELGYNSEQPMGFFNINPQIINIKVN